MQRSLNSEVIVTGSSSFVEAVSALVGFLAEAKRSDCGK